MYLNRSCDPFVMADPNEYSVEAFYKVPLTFSLVLVTTLKYINSTNIFLADQYTKESMIDILNALTPV